MVSVLTVDPLDTNDYLLESEHCLIEGNNISSKDSMIRFGPVNYLNFKASLSNFVMENNTMELGAMFILEMNSKQLLITHSTTRANRG